MKRLRAVLRCWFCRHQWEPYVLPGDTWTEGHMRFKVMERTLHICTKCHAQKGLVLFGPVSYFEQREKG